MANYHEATAVSESLAETTVDYVLLDNPSSPGVTILNRTGTAEIYITWASGTTNPAAPTVLGANCIPLPAAIDGVTIPCGVGSVVVALISSEIQAYSVVALAGLYVFAG